MNLARCPLLDFCKKSIYLILGAALFVLLSSGSNRALPDSLPLSQQNLETLARSITVRVFSPETKEYSSTGGSGIIIERQGNRYTVVTNHHVVAYRERSYQVQTSDGQFHKTNIIQTPSLIEEDISFLTFESRDRAYEFLPLKSRVNVTIGEPVLSVGFPYEEDLSQSQQPYFTEGQISRILDRPFIGGYQIGCTNLVKIGMSGGPLLNHKGELVGINGLGKHPLFGNPYVFKDGSTVAFADWFGMSQLSWAIPVESIAWQE